MAQMAQQQDYVALEWVKGEIGQTLKQAQQSLEAFAEKPKDRTALRFCLAHVHQIKGSLQMVEAHALVQLAADMEALILALEEERISDSIEALQVLMQAILQLPLWLEQLSGGQSDLTLSTLPLCNQLRAACGQAPLTDGKPPALKLPAPRPPLPAGDLLERDSADLNERLHRMRLALQKALPGIVRGQDIQTNLDYLSRVFSALSRLCQQAPLYPLWQVASALAEGLKSGAISTTPTLHILLRKLDHELKQLIERGIAGINQNPPEDLLSALLLQVASAANGSPRLDALKAEYGLDALQDAQALADNAEGLGYSSQDALRAVVSALCEDLLWVKDELDLFVRGRGDDVAVLNSLLAPLKQVESTLSVLGFAQAQKAIQTQIDTLHALTSGQKTLAHELLLDIAGALLYVESSLIGMVTHDDAEGQQPLPEAINLPHSQQLVLQESLSRLGEVKDAFIAFINADWKREPLEVVPELLSEVSGALHLASFERAGKILAFCKDYVEQHLLAAGQMPPDWQSLDRLADAISAVEYYLERLRINPPEQGEALLALAEQSLQALAGETAADDEPLAVVDDHDQNATTTASAEPEPIEAVPESGELTPDKADELTLDSEPVTRSEPLSIGEVLAAPASPINPPAEEVPLSLLPPPADEEPLDDELLEVFIEELNEVQDALHKLLPAWQNATQDPALLGDIRRAFHTLKGSGRMVRALIIGELSWSVENLLNRVLDGSREASEEVLSLVLEVSKLLPELRDEFAANAQRQRDDVDSLAIRAHALAKSESPAAALIDEARIDSEPTEPVTPLAIDEVSSLDPASVFTPQPEQIAEAQQLDTWLETQPVDFAPSQQPTADEQAQEENAWVALEPPAEPEDPSAELINQIPGEEAQTSSEPPALDVELLEIFQQEAEQHLAVLADFLAGCVQQLPQPIPNSLQSALHTLKGSAHIAGILPIAQIATALEKFTDTLKTNRLSAELAEASLFGRAGSLLRQGLLQLQTVPLHEIPGSDELLRDIAQLQEQRLNALHLREAGGSEASPDTQRGKLLAEGMDLLLEAGLLLEQWKDSQSIPDDLKDMLAQWDELADTAQTTLPPFEALCRAQLALYQAVVAGELPAGLPFFEQTQKTHELLLSMLDNVALLMEVADEPEQIAALQALLVCEPAEDVPLPPASSQEPPAAEITDQSVAVEHAPPEPEPEPEPAFEVTPEPAIETSISAESEDDALDEELLAIFLEEGSEILSQAASQLQRWIEQPQEGKTLLPVLQRHLHTLKGSARATGFLGMGHLAHAVEFLYEDLAEGQLAQSHELLELLQQGHDHLALMLEAMQSRQTPPDGEDLIRAITRFRGGAEEEPQPAIPAPAETPIASSEPPSLSLEKTSKATEPPASEPAATSTPASTTPASSSRAPSVQLGKVLPFSRPTARTKPSAPVNQEQVRIAANKLDSFSNLAGEISIFRARIEQQVGDFALTLNEMETTIERVRRQLRQLDIETQAQTLSSVEAAAGQSGEDFDPLEMDRHSQLQQLARALFESATDLLDLKQELTTQSRDAQTLLLQQARASSELQESLMHTRLVRFERVVPRLSRIVRQLSRELDKKVELSVDNAQSELDRILLEHLNAPLEHMLRNAIDHGIESSVERLAAGKPASGHIRLSLTRDGGDILLTLEDDGRGIDLEKVRRKAIERGLAQEDDRLSEQEIHQFVLQAGFSTATKVSETSGRGIGMDVVQAEIRRAGGSLSIHSSQGSGTRFTIRLPFTVSVSRALMVRTGDDLYALALATVEGVARLSADELANQYAQPTPTISYAGQDWTLHYLGDLLGNGQKPKLVGHNLPLPVILVKSAERYLAVQVDSLAGAREIVVKGLSHPFGSIPGISGATILGDGSVVVILDLPTLLRKRQQQLLITQDITAAVLSEGRDRPLLIMVVDDSITVRKVTSRLLERNGMNVLTAKDGMEAIALLQEHKPDLMLLDIEMPRMDGFEVATLVRHSETFKELPIIMITSRTGTKHRERGLSLGVNDYLGKPYQDAQLLGRIEQLTQRRQHA